MEKNSIREKEVYRAAICIFSKNIKMMPRIISKIGSDTLKKGIQTMGINGDCDICASKVPNELILYAPA
jgi:hypothetical protein